MNFYFTVTLLGRLSGCVCSCIMLSHYWEFALSLLSLFTYRDKSDSLLSLFLKEQLEKNEQIALFTFLNTRSIRSL